MPLLAGLAIAARSAAGAPPSACALASAVPTAVLAAITARVGAERARHGRCSGTGSCVDAAGGVLVGVIGLVGAASVARLARPTSRRRARASSATRRPHAHYYTALLLFWAALLAVPLAANLGAAWLLIEATTAASALLVGVLAASRGALEAAWKYLVLTSLGLGIALLGLWSCSSPSTAPAGRVGLAYTSIHAAGARARSPARAPRLPAAARRAGRQDRLGARAQLASGRPLARRPRRSRALLSAALLPTVLLVAWRIAAGARGRRRRAAPRATSSSSSGSPRSRSRCRSCGDRSPGSACSPTRASSTWA